MNEKQMNESDELQIDLGELFRTFLQKWWLILAVSVITALIAAGVTKFAITPMYQSQSMLYILGDTTNHTTEMSDLQIGQTLTSDIKVIATSKAVIDEAIDNIEDKYDRTFTNDEILDMLSVFRTDDTRILTIQTLSPNPEDACIIANAVAEETSKRAGIIMKTDAPSILVEAEVSKEPVSPSLPKNTVIGFLIGALIVCVFLVIKIMLNDSIKSSEDIEKYLNEATLAAIPYMKEKDEGRKKQKRRKKTHSTHKHH